MSPSFATVVVPINAGTVEDVRAKICSLGNPATQEMREKLEPLGCVHFMSMTVISERPDGDAFLLIELSVDGSAESALDKLAESLGEELDQILKTAAAASYSRINLVSFLQRHNLTLSTAWTNALYVNRVVGLHFDGLPGMTLARIREEDALARAIVATGKLHDPMPPLEKLRAIRRDIWAEGMKSAFSALDTPLLRPVRPPWSKRDLGTLAMASLQILWPLLLVLPVARLVLGLALGATAPISAVLLVSVVVWTLLGFAAYWTLTADEAADVPDDTPPDPETAASIMEKENGGPLNSMVTVSRMKPGWFRRLALRTVFKLTQTRLANVGCPGFLGSSGEIGTLHTGRWFVLPNTDLLVFVAHYDGSWLSYMQDFVDLIAPGPTSIWSNTLGFPRTRLLRWDGAADSDRATRWFRRQQRSVDFWYADTPGLTRTRIRTNAKIRQGFATAETAQEAETWLSLFGAPTPPTDARLPADSTEIPTLIYGALSGRQHAACMVLAFGEEAAPLREWLRALAPRLTYGRAPKQLAAAHVLALSATGLRKLGLNEADLATFPTAFANGMASTARARVLGDTPESWEWGAGNRPTDAVLLIYAELRENLDAALKFARKLPGVSETRLINLEFRTKEDLNEPFGFRDGVSQPVIPGTPAWKPHMPPDQIVAPGEFVLGYKDSRGYEPPVPSVAAGRDVAGDLIYLAGGRAALGLHSSFLVVRQLKQDKKALDKFAEEAAAKNQTSAEYIKAKMLGRWPNGSSLVRHPHHRGEAPDNDFRFGLEDADGLGCPLGAHIRRANPRDSVHPDLSSAVRITNRRRILRVGRPYVERPEVCPAGILFMCLNADIERQFELVQHAWLRNPDFGGLREEADPLIGGPKGARSFTIPTTQGPLCLRGLPDFVTVLGGGYFWLPSASAVKFLSR